MGLEHHLLRSCQKPLSLRELAELRQGLTELEPGIRHLRMVVWKRLQLNGERLAQQPFGIGVFVLFEPQHAVLVVGARGVRMLRAIPPNEPWYRFLEGSSVLAGASIVGDTVYWGSGYSHLPVPGFVANNKFYAFSINGR